MQDSESKTINHYEIENHISTEELAPNYPVIRLSNKFGYASVALHGAHVTEYTPVAHKPVIFTSEHAIYKEGKAIRGGIPICWPWFNAHPTDSSLPSHGYARNQFWKVTSSEQTDEYTSITLYLSIETLSATVIITLGESLEVSLTTTNISDKEQTAGGALHSYFNVSNIETAIIEGLDGANYLDTLTDTPETQSENINISEEIDNVYINTTSSVSIYDPELNRNIIIDKTGSKSTVVWNPWIKKSTTMADLGNEEYLKFVCIEAANAFEDVYKLAPGEKHTLSTKITSV